MGRSMCCRMLERGLGEVLVQDLVFDVTVLVLARGGLSLKYLTRMCVAFRATIGPFSNSLER
jgi:hypothetical protein